MLRSFIGLGLIFTFIFSACSPDPSEDWVEHNLIGAGVPLKVLGPEDLEVKVSTLGTMQDITLKGSDDYSLQVFGMDVQTTNIEELVEEQKDMVREEAYFEKIEEEWEEGFIYSLQIDSAALDYDFRQLRLKGDKVYIFQCGMLGRNSKEKVDRLVKAVRKD
jgi:hypothetical protein